MQQLQPWRINELTVENFRCFQAFRIAFDPSLTVLVGVNGTGKTAVLDALAIMLSSVLRPLGGSGRGFTLADVRAEPRDLTSTLEVAGIEPRFPVRGVAAATLGGQDVAWERSRSSAAGRTSWGRNADVTRAVGHLLDDRGSASDETLLPIVGLYGVERLLGIRRAAGSISRSRAGAYDSTLDGKSDLSRLSAYIKALTLADFLAERRGVEADAARQQLRAITLASNAVLADTGWGHPEWSPVVQEITLTSETQGTLPLSYLSSGIRIAVGLVLDIVSRAARANPHVGAERLLDTVPGIVLIDEVDLHLHPVWQQRILPQLRRTLPCVQFIVTTHSPQVLSTVHADHIRVIDGDEVRGVDFSAGLRSDIVLEKILSTRAEPPLEINDKLDLYMELVEAGAGETHQARSLRAQLDDELGGIANVPKLADADASISFYGLDD
ncbi:AAA family ATPase [Microbacterium proteolyticum]|jgi:predicted ATP-binding protein involved in virulence|uniref:AAA family ATPase n=1 Tax=Microbacterium proteolyticum TaxID=1572644 RepID=UPI0035C0B3E5